VAAARAALVANGLHELRTPLAAVVGLLRLLADTRLDAEQRECAELLQSSAASLDASVADLVDLSRMQSGEFAAEETPFEPSVLASECVERMRAQAHGKRIVLAVETAPSARVGVSGDGARLARVLLHVVERALRRSSDGRVVVRAAARASGRAFREVEFSVRAAAKSTPTADFADDESFAAAMSRAVCASMGWKLDERGATIRLSGRFRAGADDATPVGADDPAPRRSLRVLVADDDPVGRRAAVGLLERIGHAPSTAADGHEAIRAAEASRPHAVLMDLSMPGLDAPALVRQLRSMTVPPVVVGMTSGARRKEIDLCLAAGMSRCLVKPLDERAVARALPDVASDGAESEPVRAESASTVAPEVAAELIDLFVSNAPDEIARLREGAARGDFAAQRWAAHRLMGMSATVAADSMVALAEEAERVAGSTSAMRVVRRIERAWPRTRDALLRRRPRSRR